MKAFLGHTVQDKLPDFHTTFTFTFDKLKRSVTLPTKYEGSPKRYRCFNLLLYLQLNQTSLLQTTPLYC